MLPDYYFVVGLMLLFEDDLFHILLLTMLYLPGTQIFEELVGVRSTVATSAGARQPRRVILSSSCFRPAECDPSSHFSRAVFLRVL